MANHPHPRFHYEKIAADLRARIHGGDLQIGAALPPEKKLAAELGVTHLTVRKALAILEAERLLLRQQGRGTFVADRPAPAVGSGILFLGEYESHFYRDIYLAACAEGQATGHPVTAYRPSKGPLSAPEREAILQRAREVRAVLLVMPRRDDDLVAGLQRGERGLVTLSYQSEATAPAGHHVQADSMRGVTLAVRHLIENGHRRIAFVTPYMGSPEVPAALPGPRLTSSWYQGYRVAMQEQGLPEQALGITAEGEGPRLAQLQAFAAGLRDWATAYAVSDDYNAVMLCRALAALGLRVPEDVSVTGLGCTPWSETHQPPLTTVDLGAKSMARLAVRLALLPPPPEPLVCSIQPHLVPRASVLLR